MLGVVDIGGQGLVPGFGPRIYFTPAAPPEAAGSPILDSSGQVAGIVGGSVRPGARIDRVIGMGNRELHEALVHGAGGSLINSATPVSEVVLSVASAKSTLSKLATDGFLTPSLQPMAEFVYGGTTAELRKSVSSGLPVETQQFSSMDAEIGLFTLWLKKGKISKGTVSVSVFDALNRVKAPGPGRKLSLGHNPQQVSFSFPRTPLAPGTYRADVHWDGQTVWRTYFRVVE